MLFRFCFLTVEPSCIFVILVKKIFQHWWYCKNVWAFMSLIYV